MPDPQPPGPLPPDPEGSGRDREVAGPSYGNMGPGHWSRTRSERNSEALEYYRERSRAPGVAEGGSERNFYCMRCDGVIPHDQAGTSCPHCGVEIDERVKRYFNWVEINEPPRSDALALLPWLALAGLVVLAAVAWIAISSWN
jgi:hypothetical protein